MGIFYPDFFNEPFRISSTENSANMNSSTKDVATQVNFGDIKINSIRYLRYQLFRILRKKG